ncbi:MAG: MFS transporter [Anaerolineae bacterium]|nr:SLC45 family MFS transporter [Chloroflexota bacterium]
MKWLPLNAYWFGVSFMWAAVHTLVLPELIALYGGPERNSLYGLLTLGGLLLALLATPVTGYLSDRTHSPWGRRPPWMVLGALASATCLLVLVHARSWPALAGAYLLLQLSSNLAHGPGQGLIPDKVPPHQRGIASGVKAMLDMLGIVAAALVVSRVLEGGAARHLAAGAITAGVLLLSLMPTLAAARGGAGALAAPAPARRTLRAIYGLNPVRDRDYVRLLASRFLVLLGVYAVQAFAYYYISDAVAPGRAASTVGNLMAIIALSVLVAAGPAGYLSERWGRRALSLVACTAVALGMGALALVRTAAGIGLIGAVIGLGMGIFTTVNWAWATDLVPPQEAGRYLGLSNLATAGSAATARLLGPLIDRVNASHPLQGYSLMFILAACAALMALILTLRGERRPGAEVSR